MGPTLFPAGGFRSVELGNEDLPVLQVFFERNSEYFIAVNGQPATASEANEEMHEALPAGMPYTRRWVVGFVDDSSSLAGVANLISDLLAPHVWHIGLFMVATSLHGSRVAHSLYGHLEKWMQDRGAQWLRLGVVVGNLRAERFWERLDFTEVRKRTDLQMGKRINTVRVMVKPLTGGRLPEYLAMVARDRPDP
jgi:ribosomal protein S18 acetylase RimI-like enzyme